MNVANLIRQNANQIKRFIYKESPTIFTGLGITGVFTTTVLGIRATPPALYIIDRERHLQRRDKLTNLEIVKLTWKCYLPTAASALLTASFIIAANKINLRRNAALLSLYTLSEASLKEYQEKVIEMIGANKEEKIRGTLAQRSLEEDPIETKQVIITGKGETLFYDSLSGRYFKSDMELIRKKINDFNAELVGDIYLSLNDFYDLLNLEPIKIGEDSGWIVDHGLLSINWSAKIATNDQPCIVMNFVNGPRPLTSL